MFKKEKQNKSLEAIHQLYGSNFEPLLRFHASIQQFPFFTTLFWLLHMNKQTNKQSVAEFFCFVVFLLIEKKSLHGRIPNVQ